MRNFPREKIAEIHFILIVWLLENLQIKAYQSNLFKMLQKLNPSTRDSNFNGFGVHYSAIGSNDPRSRKTSP